LNTLRLTLITDMDCRTARYMLHKLENIDKIRPEILKRAVELDKSFRRTITLSDVEEKIYEKYGKATNLMVNYAIIAEGME